MSLSPWEQYQEDLTSPHFLPDPSQQKAMKYLDDVYHRLCEEAEKRNTWHAVFRKPKLIMGHYLWGSVGTGKSYLMSTFFHCLPFPQKMRVHFHEFMQQVHQALKKLQGQKNPLEILAKTWAKNTYVLCFDEFFVKDIADAMILSHVLQALFSAGVTVIATSNVPPDDLYKNGLQRERFLPAINVLKQYVMVLKVDNQVDYRLQNTKPADIYFSPLDDYAKKMMLQTFHYYAQGDAGSHEPLIIEERAIEIVRHTSKIAWFTFHSLCETLRSTEDYLAIASRFPMVMLSDIPIIPPNKKDIIVRFINLIDVLYDKHILVIISAETSIDKLYCGTEWAFEFQRTQSRLLEMQSQVYAEECLMNGAIG